MPVRGAVGQERQAVEEGQLLGLAGCGLMQGGPLQGQPHRLGGRLQEGPLLLRPGPLRFGPDEEAARPSPFPHQGEIGGRLEARAADGLPPGTMGLRSVREQPGALQRQASGFQRFPHVKGRGDGPSSPGPQGGAPGTRMELDPSVRDAQRLQRNVQRGLQHRFRPGMGLGHPKQQRRQRPLVGCMAFDRDRHLPECFRQGSELTALPSGKSGERLQIPRGELDGGAHQLADRPSHRPLGSGVGADQQDKEQPAQRRQILPERLIGLCEQRAGRRLHHQGELARADRRDQRDPGRPIRACSDPAPGLPGSGHGDHCGIGEGRSGGRFPRLGPPGQQDPLGIQHGAPGGRGKRQRGEQIAERLKLGAGEKDLMDFPSWISKGLCENQDGLPGDAADLIRPYGERSGLHGAPEPSPIGDIHRARERHRAAADVPLPIRHAEVRISGEEGLQLRQASGAGGRVLEGLLDLRELGQPGKEGGGFRFLAAQDLAAAVRLAFQALEGAIDLPGPSGLRPGDRHPKGRQQQQQDDQADANPKAHPEPDSWDVPFEGDGRSSRSPPRRKGAERPGIPQGETRSSPVKFNVSDPLEVLFYSD
ncbi:hypothetical protein HRbin22_01948 [Candidatus Thermoflexus japonica]|uniref:Uncharacterized protein n=1 Tax=Candidatus Thermoflexus japonica TaxID=2035417 RepID=A0A2H5Y8E3_9CHLR|nr:hypothetical protein HRbin22_01948 [Candidatus Thermoflexus japonica]